MELTTVMQILARHVDHDLAAVPVHWNHGVPVVAFHPAEQAGARGESLCSSQAVLSEQSLTYGRARSRLSRVSRASDTHRENLVKGGGKTKFQDGAEELLVILSDLADFRFKQSIRQLLPHNTQIPVVRTYLLPFQLLVQRSSRPIAILRKRLNTKHELLPGIRLRVLLIAPAAVEVEPVHRCAVVVGRESTGFGIKGVVVGAERGIPERALISVVLQRALREIDVRDCVVVRS